MHPWIVRPTWTPNINGTMRVSVHTTLTTAAHTMWAAVVNVVNVVCSMTEPLQPAQKEGDPREMKVEMGGERWSRTLSTVSHRSVVEVEAHTHSHIVTGE